MKQIDHIGIAVKDLEEAVAVYERLLNVSCYKRETVENQKVETAFFETGEAKVELLEATSADSVIAAYLREKGEGMHHVAFEVGDVHAEMQRLQAEGFKLLSDKPSVGADNKLVVFIHPKGSHGVLVELCQSISR